VSIVHDGAGPFARRGYERWCLADDAERDGGTMACFWSLRGRWLIARASALAFIVVLQVVIRVNGPAIGLDRAKGILYPLLVALGSCLRFAFSLTDATQFAILSLLLSSTLRIDGSWETIGALVDLWDIVGGFVIADDVLPRVALFAQDRVPIVVGEATDTLDGRRLFLFDGAV